jgi:hypothetical protein
MCYGQRDPNILSQILQCFSLSEKSIASEIGDLVSKIHYISSSMITWAMCVQKYRHFCGSVRKK